MNSRGEVMTAAKRLRLEREEALQLMMNNNGGGQKKKEGGGEPSHDGTNARTRAALSRRALAAVGGGTSGKVEVNGDGGDDDGDHFRSSAIKEEQHQQDGPEPSSSTQQQQPSSSSKATSLLEQAAQLKKNHSQLTDRDRAALERQQDEERILKEASHVQTNALQAASELAEGTKYKFSLPTAWRCPAKVMREASEWENIRKKWHILVEGEDIPPPIRSFGDMAFPPPIMEALKKKNVKRPTPIQMQGLTVALSGRDMVGIAFTGSGKTLSFSLPLVMAALEEEARMPLVPGEGPVGIVLAPSRELARQTYEVVTEFCTALTESGGRYPSIRSQLLIGGESARDQLQPFRDKGVHCVVATPGRLRDFLKKRSINLDICRYICLDEADRMLDLGFDEEVGEIMNHFHHQRQTILYSATFPKKFQDFAKQTLVRPVVVNVGRAGAANLDVIQEVEYVKQEAKIVYLLECLQKTAPPVVIFCEKKGDVDDIHEYLLLKGVEAVSIHGGKDQEERNEAIALYKAGKKDVLVATDIAAKGLDFADIQHVINFDMPSEIENYVHRIGRTGRCGKTGVATTFINKSCEETTLLDLKHLLKEAHQRIPPVLMIMDDPFENVAADGSGPKGCSFCGGLGHTIVDCPKIDKDARRVAGGRKDALATGDGYGGEI
ncbi:DEAD/DEAH box RNA helicase [Thalassiosira pseudonana CCMP1335]|uniref:RNA helicase n=1 Tax=Thalassiosira pseudonana TaxID=35128 RepID=B8C8J5_THAPS|nr:DEAD/DEAH box RNA helicase [Thalassiosira pseudonana CCMP1335]EED90297.1 DEAD/DEAH box RNA helicase [Thalassiosira pseudonana CCMP1335]